MPRPRPLVASLAAGVLLAGLTAACTADGTAPGGNAAPARSVVAPAAAAAVVGTRQVAPRVVDLTVRSPAVGADVPVRLLLPRGFRAEGARRWPVLLLLHGCCSGYRSWTEQTDIEALARRSGVIVAMPDGGRAGLYSDWLDGPQWETFHTEELLRVLEERYAASGRRAIAGLSMGGLGALGYAARNPGLFAAAASFSGITDTLHNRERPDNYLGLVRSEGQDPLAVWGDPVRDVEVWREHNPTDLAARLAGTALFVSTGNGAPGPLDRGRSGLDLLEYALWQENRALRRALRAAGVEATFDFYGPGTHSWPYWERELRRAWPLLVTALSPSGARPR